MKRVNIQITSQDFVDEYGHPITIKIIVSKGRYSQATVAASVDWPPNERGGLIDANDLPDDAKRLLESMFDTVNYTRSEDWLLMA